jgi:hypothetical protein
LSVVEAPPKRLVSIKEAHKLRPYLSERFLRYLHADGRVPSWILANRVMFDLEDLDAYVASCRSDQPGGERRAEAARRAAEIARAAKGGNGRDGDGR